MYIVQEIKKILKTQKYFPLKMINNGKKSKFNNIIKYLLYWLIFFFGITTLQICSIGFEILLRA